MITSSNVRQLTDDELRIAHNEYMRRYRTRKDKKPETEDQAAKRKAYQKAYRERNPERVKEWRRRAIINQAKKLMGGDWHD